MLSRTSLFTVLALGLVLVPRAGAATLTLSPVRDATLYDSTTGALANGAGDHLFAGNTGSNARRRALLFFDVAAQLPADAVVETVTLRLHLSKTNAGDRPATLHRVLASWAEGPSDPEGEEGNGATAQDGDVTWVHRLRPGTQWTTPGGEFVAAASATQTVGGTDGPVTWSGPGLVADVQAWLADPASEHGWVLRGDETTGTTAKRFSSREHPAAEERPQLVVTYGTGDPTPCAAGSLCLNDDRFEVTATWTTRSGATGAGVPVELTSDTGYFWFFDDSNVEVVVKVLDGCGTNGRFWVFAGGLTNVEVVMRVRDTVSGQVRTYTNPQRTPFQPIQDTAAFTGC